MLPGDPVGTAHRPGCGSTALEFAEDGMSETIQNVLWAIFAIAIVGIVAAIIQAYVVGKAGEIR